MSGDAWERARSPPEAPFRRIPDQQMSIREREVDMQGSEVNISERFGHALAQVRNILDEHEISCAERVRAAEEKAQGDINRFGEASGELTQARRELSALEAERGRLPFEAYAANLDGDIGQEEALRSRYQEINPEHLDHLRGRIETLEREVASLGGTASGAEKRALKNVRAAYDSVLQSMGEVEGRIDLLKSAAEELRSKLWSGQRAVAEQQNLVREVEQAQRRQERAEAARSEEARRGVRPGSRV